MPRYQFDLETDEQTASSLVSLCLGACSKFNFRLVEDSTMVVLPAPKEKRKLQRVKGTSTFTEIWKLCNTATNNTASRARMTQVFDRFGWSKNSISPAVSRLILTGLFEHHKDGIRMLDSKTTLEQVIAANKIREALVKGTRS